MQRIALKPEHIFVWSNTYRSARLEIREKITVSPDRIDALYKRLRQIQSLDECLVLKTCNRMELYAISCDPDIQRQIQELFCHFQHLESVIFSQYGFWKYGTDMVRHIFEVASGLDSQIIGETEIFGQVKQAYNTAIKKNTIGPVLHKIFQKSFQAAKWIRSNTAINQGQVSIGNITAKLAERFFGNLEKSRILIAGTGQIGQKTAKSFRSRGVRSITIMSRTAAKACILAREINAQLIAFNNDQAILSNFDIIVCSTAAPHFILSYKTVQALIKLRPQHPLLLIDLAVPRDIQSHCASIPNVFLYNLDDLQKITNENLDQRKYKMGKCREYLDKKTKLLWNRHFKTDSLKNLE
jgi:glutamyl-tRNA reductase